MCLSEVLIGHMDVQKSFRGECIAKRIVLGLSDVTEWL